jgi:hypothetical protein
MFMRGNAIAHAEREQVVLMEIESLIAILEMYRQTPLSLYTLREMFIRPGLYGTALDPVREAHEQVDLLTALGPLIVQTIEQWYARGHVEAVNADALFYAFIERFQRVRYPRELIDAALMYLASPFIGALRKNDVGYYLTMPARTVRHRLLRLGESFQQVPAGVSTRREVQADDKRGIQQLE